MRWSISIKSMRRHRVIERHDHDLYRRLDLAFGVLIGVLATGVVGYRLLGLSFLDALYQTVTTVSTVGFKEIGDVTTTYKIFTIFIVLVGAGSVLYFVGVLLETLLEGRLTDEFARRRLMQDLAKVSDHVVVCGWGQVGRAITHSLDIEGAQVVVIDRTDEVTRADVALYVVGDATDDEVLRQAGVDRARALVTALDAPADNVYVTLSGRTLNPDLFIVARANSTVDENKLFRAGADRVVNPHERGGAHMAALVLQPNVAEFLGVVMHDRELAVRIEEVEVRRGSALAGNTLERCASSGSTILAVRTAGGFVHHPPPTRTAEPGDVLIALGTAEEHERLRAVTGG